MYKYEEYKSSEEEYICGAMAVYNIMTLAND